MFLNGKLIMLVAGCVCSLQLLAATHHLNKVKWKHPRTHSFQRKHPNVHFYKSTYSSIHPWSFIASLGYSKYDNMYDNDGQTAVSKLSFGKELFSFNMFKFGIEAGVQSGNTMRIYSSEIVELGGLPVQTTVKPIIDLLATIKTIPLYTTPFFLQAKGGPGYIQWQFDNNDSIKNQSKFIAEVQGGVGYQIKDYLELSLLYQGFLGGKPVLTIKDQNINIESISTIPMQNGVLLSLSMAFN